MLFHQQNYQISGTLKKKMKTKLTSQ